MSTPTFYLHDYETWGVEPRFDRPSQFAGIRTDLELNILDEPVMLYCKPARDYLPHMYGAANYAVIDEVRKLPLKVSDIYRRLTT